MRIDLQAFDSGANEIRIKFTAEPGEKQFRKKLWRLRQKSLLNFLVRIISMAAEGNLIYQNQNEVTEESNVKIMSM